MVKLIIFGVLGLVVGLGGGAAVSVTKAKKTFAAYEAKKAQHVADSLAHAEEGKKGGGEHGEGAAGDSTAHDSTGTGEPVVASAEHETPAAAPTHAPEAKPASEHKAEPKAATEHASEPAPKGAGTRAVATVEAHGGATSTKAAPPRPPLPTLRPSVEHAEPASAPPKVAKIFGAMAAKDAAKVLEQLEDTEVQAILLGLSDKQAAAIMQSLPPARAAAISKLAMRSGGKTP